MYFSDAKLNFHWPLFQSSESHDPSDFSLICWFVINIRNHSVD